MAARVNEFYSLLGSRLRSIRLKSGLTQQEVAERAGLTPPYLSYLESGKKKGTLDAYFRLAEAVGTTMEDLMCKHPRTAKKTAASAPSPIERLSITERRAVYRMLKTLKKPR